MAGATCVSIFVVLIPKTILLMVCTPLIVATLVILEITDSGIPSQEVDHSW